MKITFTDQAELKAHALEKLAELTEAGTAQSEAVAKVNKYLTKNEFVTPDGTILKLTLDEEKSAPAALDTKAIVKAVSDGMKDALKAVEVKGAALKGSVSVESEDWERLLEVTAPGKKHANYGFRNVGDFAMSLYALNGPAKANAYLDPRLALLQKAHKVLTRKAQEGGDDLVPWINKGIVSKATPTTYASELIGADGGFMVPPEYREQVWIAVRDTESILSMCDLTPTNSNVVNLVADQNLPWDNTAGIITGWRAQATTMSQSKPVLQNRQVQLNEIYALVPATDELLADTAQLNNYLSQKAPEKIGWQVDEAIFRGNGNGQPLGFLNSPALVTVTSSSSASTYTPVDLANMTARLLQPSMKNPTGIWVMTPRAYAYSINLNLGTLGYPVALPNGSLSSPLIPTILTMPVYQSQHASAFSSAGDVLLLDLKRGYAAFNKTDGVDFQTSIHLFFDSGATAFRWRFRIGGEPYLKTTVTPAQTDANASYSHFVALGAR